MLFMNLYGTEAFGVRFNAVETGSPPAELAQWLAQWAVAMGCAAGVSAAPVGRCTKQRLAAVAWSLRRRSISDDSDRAVKWAVTMTGARLVYLTFQTSLKNDDVRLPTIQPADVPIWNAEIDGKTTTLSRRSAAITAARSALSNEHAVSLAKAMSALCDFGETAWQTGLLAIRCYASICAVLEDDASPLAALKLHMGGIARAMRSTVRLSPPKNSTTLMTTAAC